MTPAALPQMDVTMADDLEGELIYSAPPHPQSEPRFYARYACYRYAYYARCACYAAKPTSTGRTP